MLQRDIIDLPDPQEMFARIINIIYNFGKLFDHIQAFYEIFNEHHLQVFL